MAFNPRTYVFRSSIVTKDRIPFIWLLITIVVDGFYQSDLVKERNDSQNTCYQISIHYKEIKNASIKNNCGIFSLVFVVKPEERMTEIFPVGLQKIDKGLTTYLNL